MPQQPLKVVFLGTHGQYNIGDELLLETFLDQLGDENHYMVNSYDPEFTRKQLGGRFTVDVINTASQRGRLIKGLLGCDVLCFGGGSIVKELYSTVGRHKYSTLLMILAIVSFTKFVARKPIYMLNIGVGPLRSRGGLRLARFILSQVDLLTVRDDKSAAVCRGMGIEAVRVNDAVFAVDPVHLRNPSPDTSVRDSAAGPDARVRIALNLNFDIERPDSWESFLTGLAAALTMVNHRCPIELHALPMQSGFKPNHDAEVLALFAQRIPEIPFVQSRVSTPQDVGSLLESCDIFVGERLHAVIISSLLGKPSFVLAYDVKVEEIAKVLSLETWTLNINAPFEAAVLADRIMQLIDQRETVAASLRMRVEDLRAEAAATFDASRKRIQSPQVKARRVDVA